MYIIDNDVRFMLFYSDLISLDLLQSISVKKTFLTAVIFLDNYLIIQA